MQSVTFVLKNSIFLLSFYFVLPMTLITTMEKIRSVILDCISSDSSDVLIRYFGGRGDV